VTAHETATMTPHTNLSLARSLRYSGSEFAGATDEGAVLTIGTEDMATGFFASPST